MQVQSLLEQLLFTTVRITTMGPGGDGLGTGFFYSADDAAGKKDLFLVTNKHVVEGATGVDLHFIARGPDDKPVLGQEEAIGVGRADQSFVGHPDPAIDVSVMRIGDVVGGMMTIGKPVFWRSVDSSLVATPVVLDEFEPIEPVTFIGYPNGLFDNASLLPIARRGHSATPLVVDYEGKPIFLVDASVFPGSSGSPVFLVVPASAPDKHGNITIGGGPRCVFLGVVAAVYQRSVPVLTTGTGAGFVHDALDIGIVYKASAVEEAIRHA